MKMLSIKQLSMKINVKTKTIYDWVHKRKIPHYKLEGCLRFNESEIMRWVESKKHKTHSQLRIV